VLTNLYHSRQLYSTLIPPSPAVGLEISRLSRPVELTLRYTTPDIHRKHRRHECDGGIMELTALATVSVTVQYKPKVASAANQLISSIFKPFR